MFGELPAIHTQYNTPADGEARVTVRFPPCRCGLRWFMCRCDVEYVTYTGPGIDGTGAPCPNFLRAVVRENKGADLIFNDGAPHLAAMYKQVLAEEK